MLGVCCNFVLVSVSWVVPTRLGWWIVFCIIATFSSESSVSFFCGFGSVD